MHRRPNHSNPLAHLLLGRGHEAINFESFLFGVMVYGTSSCRKIEQYDRYHSSENSLKIRPLVSKSGQVNSTQPWYRNLRLRLKGFRPAPCPTSRRCCPSHSLALSGREVQCPVHGEKDGRSSFLLFGTFSCLRGRRDSPETDRPTD